MIQIQETINILPPAQYEPLEFPDKKLAARFDPIRGILEIQRAGIKYYFDLTQIRLSVKEAVDKSNNLCNNNRYE